jgi:hypothetical protein
LEGAALDAIDQRDADVDATVETRPMTSATPLKTLDIADAGAGRSGSHVEKYRTSLCASNQTGVVNREVNSLDVAAQHRA